MSEKDAKKDKGAKNGKGAKDAKSGKDGGKQPKQPKQPKQGSSEGRQQAPEPRDEKPSPPAVPARLHTYYREPVVKDLSLLFGYKSVMQVPRIEKIVLNMGVGEAVADKKIMDNAVADMTKIA